MVALAFAAGQFYKEVFDHFSTQHPVDAAGEPAPWNEGRLLDDGAPIADGIGPIDAVTKPQRGRAGAIAETTTPQPDDADTGAAVQGYRQKRLALERFDKAVVKRNTAIAADPAVYAMQSDAVSQARQAIDPNNPASLATYVQSSMTEQSRLGVPSSMQRALTIPEAQAAGTALVNADPAKIDVGGQLDGMAKSYGEGTNNSVWPQVWHDLVKDGHVPSSWQILAQMPAGQDRMTMQRALQAVEQKDGLEGMRKSVGPEAAKTIRQGLDSNPDLQNLTRSLINPGIATDQKLVASARNSIEASTLLRVMSGDDPAAALRQAASSAIPYDFAGRARAPEGEGPAMSAYASSILQSLKPGDLQEAAGGAGMRPEDQRSAYLRGVQRNGQWFTNERGTGWNLWVRDDKGAWQKPLRKDGTQLGFLYDDQRAAPVPVISAVPTSDQIPAMQ